MALHVFNLDETPHAPRAAEVDVADCVFTVRELLDFEMRWILSTNLDDAVGKMLCDEIPDADLDLRHRIEIAAFGVVNPLLDHQAAIRIARHDRETLQTLTDEILELSAQATGFESVAALHVRH